MWSPVLKQLMTVTSTQNFKGLIRLPYGCGEQNMALFMPNVFLAHYLKKLGDQVYTPAREKTLTFNIKTGLCLQYQTVV